MKKENLNSLIFSIYSLIACGFLLLGKADCIAKSDLCSSPFQGPYVGGNIGYGSAQVQQYTNAQTVPAGTASIEENFKDSLSGVDGGVILGYTYVFPNQVGVGLEAVFNWARVQTTFVRTITALGFEADGYKTLALKNSFQLRIPFSYVISDRVAPKVLVGWDSSLWVNQYNQFFSLGNVAVSNTRHNGFLVGLGFDILLINHLLGGFEYTYVAFNNVSFTDQGGAGSLFTLKPTYNKFALTLKAIY